MLSAALSLLACPVCRAPLQRPGGDVGPVACPSRHSFDVARQGYVNLLAGAGTQGLAADTSDMVAARERVQSAGLYAPIAEHLARIVSDAPAPPGALIDLGGGTGYYASHLLDARPQRVGITLDLSRHAARRAAKTHPRLTSVVGNVWAGFPVRDGVCALATYVFAPRNPTETGRVLAPGGLAIVVTPRPGHLRELVTSAGMLRVDERKEQRLAEQFADFETVDEHHVTATLTLTPDAAVDVALMGPSAHHRDADAVRAALGSASGPRDVTLDVRINVFRRP